MEPEEIKAADREVRETVKELLLEHIVTVQEYASSIMHPSHRKSLKDPQVMKALSELRADQNVVRLVSGPIL
jgi:hypothetical protein